MHKVPNIIKFGVFESVGFYDYVSIKKCILKGMKNNISYTNHFPEERPSRSMLVGRFHHKLMEYTYLYSDLHAFQDAIENEIRNLQKEVAKWPHFKKCGSVSGWNEVNKSASSALRAFKKKSSDVIKGNINLEETLYSKDRILVGRPDFFFIHNDKAILREFKSSSIRDENDNIKKEYQEQLLFYSILLFDSFNIIQVNSKLESLDGDVYEKIIEQYESELMRSQILETIQIVNDNILSIKNVYELANPNAKTCKLCSKKIICKEFIRNQKELISASDGFIIEGIIRSINKGPNDKLLDVFIQDSLNQNIVCLRLPADISNELKINSDYLFTNLILANDIYLWSDKTELLSYD